MFAFPLCSRFLASMLSCTMSIYAQTPGNTWKLLGKSERLFFQIPRSSTEVSCKRTAVNRKSRRQVGGCFKMLSRMNSLRNVFHSARSRSEKVQEPFRPLRNHILQSIQHIFIFQNNVHETFQDFAWETIDLLFSHFVHTRFLFCAFDRWTFKSEIHHLG